MQNVKGTAKHVMAWKWAIEKTRMLKRGYCLSLPLKSSPLIFFNIIQDIWSVSFNTVYIWPVWHSLDILFSWPLENKTIGQYVQVKTHLLNPPRESESEREGWCVLGGGYVLILHLFQEKYIPERSFHVCHIMQEKVSPCRPARPPALSNQTTWPCAQEEE